MGLEDGPASFWGLFLYIFRGEMLNFWGVNHYKLNIILLSLCLEVFQTKNERNSLCPKEQVD